MKKIQAYPYVAGEEGLFQEFFQIIMIFFFDTVLNSTSGVFLVISCKVKSETRSINYLHSVTFILPGLTCTLKVFFIQAQFCNMHGLFGNYQFTELCISSKYQAGSKFKKFSSVTTKYFYFLNPKGSPWVQSPFFEHVKKCSKEPCLALEIMRISYGVYWKRIFYSSDANIPIHSLL